jgi:hypothetical protein
VATWRSGRIAILVSIVALLAAACGGTPFPRTEGTTNAGARGTRTATGATRPNTPAKPHAPAPTTPPTAAASTGPAAERTLRALVPTMDVLGPEWEDAGDPGTSLDLTNPPAGCAPFTSIFDGRTTTVLHEFSYLSSPDGNFERGHINLVALRAAATPMVAAELSRVAGASFAACAKASAVRWFYSSESGTIDTVSARRIALGAPSANVLWRAAVTSHSSDGTARTMYLDIGFFGAGDVFVKIRIGSCGCWSVAADAPLMTGEVAALQSIALTLASIMRAA